MEANVNSSQGLSAAVGGDVNDISPDDQNAAREKLVATLRVLWSQRRSILRVAGIGLMLSTLVAFLIPKRYTTTTRLMPPDSQSASSMMMLAGLAQKAGSGLGAMAGDLGLKSSGALFVGMLQSQTSQNH